MLPNPLVILPLFRIPVPVISPWCCVILLDDILASATVPLLKAVALSVVSPLPLPEKILVPMLMLPNPVVILPAFKAPVPVILNWCCVTPLACIRASGIVPLVKKAALISPIKLSARISLFTYKPPVILTAALPAANVAPVAFVPSVNVTKLFEASVVNAPELGVTLPIGVLLILLTNKSPSTYISVFVRKSIRTIISPKSPARVAAALVSPTTISVAACAIANVVTLSFNKLNVPVSSVSSVVPFTNKLPAKLTFVFLMLKLPVVAPAVTVVAAPPILSVVAVALTRLNIAAPVVMSPPSTFRSRSISTLLCTVVVPVAAPISTLVAAPPILIDVAVVSNNAIVALAASMPVVKLGDVANTAAPVPVSSLSTPRSCALVVEAN